MKVLHFADFAGTIIGEIELLGGLVLKVGIEVLSLVSSGFFVEFKLRGFLEILHIVGGVAHDLFYVFVDGEIGLEGFG